MSAANILVEVGDLILLYSLGLVGWFVAKKIHLPAAPILGGIFLVGGLRIIDVGLPHLHDNFIAMLQIALGIMIGTQFDRQAYESLRYLIVPAGLISIWALTITIIFGTFIARISPLDITTGILSSSIGGLPEMTVLAHDTRAEPIIVALFQIVRIFINSMLFPFVVKLYSEELFGDVSGANPQKTSFKDENKNYENSKNNTALSLRIPNLLFTFILASLTGFLFMDLGVPAGGLVGSMLFVMGAIYFRLPVEMPPSNTFSWFLVGIGLMISNQIQPETIQLVFSRELVTPLVILLILTYASSVAMAYIIYKITNWNFVICLLASAPGGIAVLTGLAIEYGYDPVKISLIHFARLVTLKLTIPFLFMIFYY